MVRKRETESADQLFWFEPRTDNQARAMEVIKNNDLTFLLGSSGSGKTICALAAALNEMREHNSGKRKQVQKILITRPIVEAGEKLGSLPGTVDEKILPHLAPIYDNVAKLVSNSEKFIAAHFDMRPLAYLRGVSMEHCVAILDEAQNCTVTQLLLFMTRLGMGGKMILSGDIDQSDIGSASGLQPWVKALRGKPGIGFVDFTEEDIVRHPLVKTILRNKPKIRDLNKR